MKSGKTIWHLFVIVLIHLAMGPTLVTADDGPKVIRTYPENNAIGISRSLDTVTFTFNRPMDTRSCGSTSSNWGPSTCHWSADGTILSMTRSNADELLTVNSQVLIILNNTGTESYRDEQGHLLGTFTLRFTIAGANIKEVPAAPSKGFFWPYFLYAPPNVSGPSVLLVEPNNTGTTSDDPNVHMEAAYSLINRRAPLAEELELPLLVPVFPRPSNNWRIYTHALDRDCLMTTETGLERIDLQLIDMIIDARQQLADLDIFVESKVFLNGYSASGSFVNRFALLHPDYVKAVASGSPGGWPTVPAAAYEGQKLIYPVGIADLQKLTGKHFDLAGYRSVPAFIYIGDADNNDAVPFSDGFSDSERQTIYQLFGAPPDYPYIRWPKAEGIFNLAGTATQFYIYPNVGHTYSNEMWQDIKTFFSHYKYTDTPLTIKEKPLRYRVYFPHMTCRNRWKTEIAIINNIRGITVNSRLEAYDASGSALSVPLAIQLSSLERMEIDVCSFFENPAEIAYIALAADSFYLAAYTKFFKAGNRVAVEAKRGKTKGIFLKRDLAGWTGIAFVNPEDKTVHVTLEALQDNGQIVAAQPLSVAAGTKILGQSEDLFEEDIGSATYLRYHADGHIIAFSLNGSSDGKMLDGLPAAAERFK